MTDLSLDWTDPDRQPALPFPAALDYARTVMTWAQEPLPAHVDARLGLAFGDHRLQRFDVYAPVGCTQAPVLLFWHGGGWTNGYRDYVRFMAPHVTRLGLVLVAPSYRLAPDARLPAAADDAMALLAHVHRHAGDWGGDGQRLLLSGHSAGGHLAALTALRSAERARHGVPDTALRACLPISGIMDLQHPAPPANSLEERVYTMVLEQDELDAAMSPLCWTSSQTVPYRLSVGANDSERVRRSNGRLRRLLAMQGTPVELQVWPDTDHFGSHTRLRDGSDPWYQLLAELA